MNAEVYRRAEAALAAHHGIEVEERLLPLARSGVTGRALVAGEGPVVVYVHGAVAAGGAWLDLASRMDGFTSVLIDRPGCGLGEPYPTPPGLDGLPGQADNLVVDVLDALEVDRAHVVSGSMGGYFALRGAAAHPDRVQRIVHFGWCLGSRIVENLPWFMRMAGMPGLGRLMARVPATRGVIKAMLRKTGQGEAVDEGRIPDEGYDWQLALSNHTDTRRNEYRLAEGASLQKLITSLALPESVLASIQAPVRIAFGTRDPFGTVASMQQLADAIPNGELRVVEGAGHTLWLDDLDLGAELARSFLAAA